MNSGYYKLFIKIIAALAIITGLLTIIGWILEVEIFKSLITGFPAMKFNTAACFILSGTSLFLLVNEKKISYFIQPVISLMILVIVMITFAQDVFGFNTGIDEWFIKDNIAKITGQGFPGRMAAPTSFCFIFLSLSFLIIPSPKKNIKIAAQYALHFVSLIALIAIFGYLYNIPTLYKLSFFSSMAVNTAVLFFLLSIGASLINQSIGFTGLFTGNNIGSLMARRLFPLTAIIVIVLGFWLLQLYWNNLISGSFSIALFAISFLLVSLFLISFTAKYLNRIDEKRRVAEESLKTINIQLEKTVAERTKEILQITERLSLATKGANIGIWDWDIIHNKLSWDDKMYELYGMAPANFSGAYDAWLNGLHPDDKEAGDSAIENAIKGKEEFDIEFRIIWPDKSIRYIKGNAIVQRNAKGEATRMVGTNWDITEQKKQMELVTQNEKKFRDLLKAAPDAMIIINNAGKIQLINQQTEKMFGYTPGELINRSVEILIPGSSTTAHKEIYSSFIHQPKWREMGEGKELVARKKSGEMIPVETSLSPLLTREETVSIASIRDITKRKEAEEEIKKNERKFHLILDAIGDNAWEHNFTTGKTTFSINIKNLLGYSNDELDDNVNHWWQHTYSEDRWMLEENDKKYTAGLMDQHAHEYRVYHKDGSIRWILDRGVVIEKDNIGMPLKIVGTHTDITERKNIEADLNKIRKQFQSFMEHIPAMTWIVDKNSVYQYTNRLYFETFYDTSTISNLTGKSFFELFPNDIATKYKDNNDIVFTTNSILQTIEPAVKKDGSKVMLKVFKFPLEITNSETLLGGVAIEITDEIKAKENLRLLNEELITSNKELEQFAYVASHDLQEPLRMVSSFMQLLEKKYKPQLDDTARQYIHFAVDGSERMKKLILDLLSFSKIGMEKHFKETVDVDKIIKEVKLNLMVPITDSHAKITVDTMPVIQGNNTQIKQLFQNLISNGIKYCSESTPEIEIGCSVENGKHNFYIKDNGIGIDNKYFEKIFIIFQRLHNKTAYSGTGVGLSICKKIVEKHGGTITVQSEPGKGSTFYFTIP